jgi:hypothetical protein
MGCRLFFCQQRQVSSHFSLFIIPIIFKDSSIQSVDNSGGSDSDEPSDDSSSDSDSDASDLHAPEALLHFPSPDEQDDSAAPDLYQNDEENDSAESETYCDLPSTVLDLQHDLLGKHELPKSPPTASGPRPLTDSEMLSLKHYIAWKKSNGTVLAYKLHAEVLHQATGIKVLALCSVQKLAIALTELKPLQVDMCPKSCMAFTGKFAKLESCIHSQDGKICGELRYKPKARPNAKDKPRAQMMALSVITSIKAMYANADTSTALRHRDKCLQKALALMATASGAVQYSDFCDSKVHMHHHQSMGLFQDKRDIALALSTDGAQLTLKKKSDTWILILMVLNFPPEIRYKSKAVIYPFAIPGPNPPGNIESYLYVLFEDMAIASEGIWMWDAVDSSYFVNRAYICMALGDMLGSAKLNGMAGHSAIYGDRFSLVKGAKASNKKGAKAQYYPVSSSTIAMVNPGRPSYNFQNLPLREEDFYWKTIEKLQNAPNKAQRTAITKDTGISRMPLCAASPAFLHPSFFPLDPFHLFYENCMAFIWDLWMTLSVPADPIHINTDMARKFGGLVSEAMTTLPASFCGLVRDPFLKRQSQYKIYEWMALLHWYIIPLGIELGFPLAVLENFSHFVEAVEVAMTISPRSSKELANLYILIQTFLEGFERLYVGNDPEKLSRCRLCIFQLIHVPIHIEWNGSIRIGSQATVERAIGEVGHKIRSKKAPFANLANIIYEREVIKLLLLYYPSLEPMSTRPKDTPVNTYTPRKEIKILKEERASSLVLHEYLSAIYRWLDRNTSFEFNLRRWGKVGLPGGAVLRSRLSETNGHHPSRSARYFEAQKDGLAEPVFGEALAFFEVVETHELLVVYYAVDDCHQVLRRWRGTWKKEVDVMPVSAIHSVIGIWSSQKKVYILRKHPGLALLGAEEAEKSDANEQEDEDGECDIL